MPEVEPPIQEAAQVRVRRRRRRRRRNWFRRQWEDHRARTILVSVALLLVFAMLLWLLFLNKQLGDVRRFPMDLDARPPAGEGTTILMLGIDDPDWRYGDPPVQNGVFEMLESGDWQPGRYRSDAIIVAHITADHQQAQLISIPRDSYVPIEGHGRSKINAAFSWGGPELMTRTVEDLTRLRVDHVMAIDFTHFIELTETIGGVDIRSDQPIALAGEEHPAGQVHLEGEDALSYVRARYQLPRGDFDRVQRHQNFLRALMRDMISAKVLANPVRLTRTAMELSDMVAVDDSLTPGRMRSLALSSRGLRPGNMRFVTAPDKGTDNVEGAGSIVRLDTPKVRDLFAAVGDDNFEGWYSDHEIDELPGEAEVE